MNKKTLREFVEQFGKNWECSCKTPFKISNLEIISETEGSILARYVCPTCQLEQILSAAFSEEKPMLEDEIQTIVTKELTADDVLDIRQEVKTMKPASVRALYRGKIKKAESETVERFTPTIGKSKA